MASLLALCRSGLAQLQRMSLSKNDVKLPCLLAEAITLPQRLQDSESLLSRLALSRAAASHWQCISANKNDVSEPERSLLASGKKHLGQLLVGDGIL
jgi:hypothetical protein